MGGTAIIITLGCRLNRADEALLTTRLEEAGFQVAAPAPGVDLPAERTPVIMS